MQYLLEFYNTSGHRSTLRSLSETLTENDVVQNELNSPNSTIDAKRIIKTVMKIMPSEENAHFLDVGCGYGFFAAEAMRCGFEVHALELAAQERQFAKSIAGINATPVAFEEYSAPKSHFSVILMSQILEHAFDVDHWLTKANFLLKPGGVLAVAVPNFSSLFRHVMQEKEPFICPPAHLNYFNITSLTHFLVKHGFQIEKTESLSRIPAKAFAKRIPLPLRHLSVLFSLTANLCLRAANIVTLGQFINVYATKAY